MLCVQFLFWYIAYNWNYGILATPARTIVKTRLNPSVFWLGAYPDGLLYDCESTKPDGLLEIKCPEGKKNSTPSEIMNDPSFYVELSEGKSVLKTEHRLGYYSQIQFQLGLSQLPWCGFVVYTFKGVII